MMLRALPLVLLAAASFGVGIVLASGSADVDAAENFANAWAADDYTAMYAELNPDAQAQISEEDFTKAYEDARETSTLNSLEIGDSRGPISQPEGDVVAVEVTANTDSFGTISGELAIPVADGGVAWAENLVFPGLESGETLDRKTKAPERAPILAADKSALAEGPVDARTTNGAGGIVAGEVGEPDPDRAKQLTAEGFAEGTAAGTSGLEMAFDEQLSGTPGGELLAVGEDGEKRTIAKSDPIPGTPLKTTIDPDLQQAASDALAGQYGGVAVLDAKNGNVLAVAGLGFSAPQPPGSTMKMVTASTALEDGVADLDSEYPVQQSTVVGGREIDNAHQEYCGGNLITSFAKSCNTVFAPIGVDIGADRFVESAEKFGFNSPPSIYNEDVVKSMGIPASTLPDPLGSDLDVGVSAIGQGEVLATPLEMASVAQTIANNGVRSPTSLVKDKALKSDAEDVKVISPETADEMRKMMIEVVQSGTGTAGAVPEAQVAGKTGTAELGIPVDGAQTDPDNPDAEPEQKVDAWFASFAPADDPKYVVAVMLVEVEEDGGTVAAPIAAQIYSAAL